MCGNSVHTFISTLELAGLMSKPNYKLLDLREHSKYVKGHITGSIHIDNNIFVQQNEDGVNVIPNCEMIESYLSKKGIRNEDILILIDDVFNLNCSLAAWTLHYFGFKNVILVDGAFSKWEVEHGELSTEAVYHSRGDISLDQQDDSILISKDEIMMNLHSEEFIFVDNRSEYAMLLDQQGGNIPGAVHLWYLDLFEEHPDYFIVKKTEELLDELTARGITRDKTIIVYCESAPQSALVYLVLKELGFPDVKLYLAGYDEWRLNCGFL
jgi:thiosulfate/3-mercaptopyruvate sulfurtransferase